MIVDRDQQIDTSREFGQHYLYVQESAIYLKQIDHSSDADPPPYRRSKKNVKATKL